VSELQTKNSLLESRLTQSSDLEGLLLAKKQKKKELK
jgi:hypothetical protein